MKNSTDANSDPIEFENVLCVDMVRDSTEVAVGKIQQKICTCTTNLYKSLTCSSNSCFCANVGQKRIFD